MKLAKLTSIIGMALSIGLALAASATAQTQTLTVLHTFTGLPDGARPLGRLLLDPAGNLYGTTTIGGTIGYGSVFKADSSGNESVFYSFAGPPDGNEPLGGLIQDAAGNLYGTTGYGGTTTLCGTDQKSFAGCGIVFKLDPSGTETVLHRFGSNGPDGAAPDGTASLGQFGYSLGLHARGRREGVHGPHTTERTAGRCRLRHRIQGGCGWHRKSRAQLHKSGWRRTPWRRRPDQAGNLYGVTLSGGLQNCPSAFFGDCGTVFKVDTSGQLSTFYSFKGGDGGPDGDIPESSLILDPAGNLYGPPTLVAQSCVPRKFSRESLAARSSN